MTIFEQIVRPRAPRVLCVAAVLAVSLSCALSGPAFAETAAPGWRVTARTLPTHLPPGGEGHVEIYVYDAGAAPGTGELTVTDKLPEGVTSNGLSPHQEGYAERYEGEECTGSSVVTCEVQPLPAAHRYTEVKVINLSVAVSPNVSASGTNIVSVTGGGALEPAVASDPVSISGAPAPFGFADIDGWLSNADGTTDTQAGSHPYELTLAFDLNTYISNAEKDTLAPSGGEIKDVTVNLPPGLVGNPDAVPRCSRAQFDNEAHCPGSTQVGYDEYATGNGEEGEYNQIGSPNHAPVYNLVPPAGVAAQFGFEVEENQVFIDSGVRTGANDAIVSHANNTPQRKIAFNSITLWGDPADPTHNAQRVCFVGSVEEFPCASNAERSPLLTVPTSCSGPLEFTAEVNSWETNDTAHASFLSHDSQGTPVGLSGCESLGFSPSISAAPDTSESDTPAGLTVEVKPSVGGLEAPEGLSTADIQNTTVTLPEGFVINPGQAAGLQACGPAEDGLTTPAEAAEGRENDGPPSCPNASKVGTVTIKTPLIESAQEKQFEGSVYVLQSNPPELKLLVAASADGVNLKLVGVVHLNERTGQLETKFQGTPELPFTDFKLSFSGGAQAALDTPTHCGTYTTTSDFSSWSSPLVADAFPESAFAIDAGPGGGACSSSPLPFSPSLTAGSTTDHAGAFTGFSMLLQRGDGQQRIEKLAFRAPAGLAGLISSVPLCDEAQANAGTCPAASHIGHAVVSSGPGPYPLVLPQPGEPELPIYLTGPYKGAPFGLSIVTPVLAGPFNLGTIVTRAKIEVDPITAQITVATDPLPQIVAGVPTDLRSIDAVIDRPGFMFNPTNCEPSSFSGTAWGTAPPGASEPGQSAALASHFGVGSCRELAFTPKLSITTAAKASKAKGASLNFKISYPKGAQGAQSWFKEAKFDIPKQLPARLTTIQKACLAATFESNRSACPAASIIGHALVHTPVLPVPLEGPVYFVSYGGAKFPDAVILLSGDGVNVRLTGETFINGKTGVTSATFPSTPDVPFESIEVSLPTGEYSEFGANLPGGKYDFCGQKLAMPTLFKAQNGLEIHESTPVTVSGCSSAISLSSHSVKSGKLALTVYVPGAGRLKASGKGLKSASKSAGGQELLTLSLQANKKHSFKAKVRLTFTPSKGKRQGRTVSLRA